MPTSQQFDLSKFASNEPSLVLPYVYTNVSSEKIESTLNELDLGEIDRIDRIEKFNHRTGQPFNVVFVHFKAWNESTNAISVRQLLLNDRDAQIYYDDNWYWKARAYVPKVKTPPPADERAPKARIEFAATPAVTQTKETDKPSKGFTGMLPRPTETANEND